MNITPLIGVIITLSVIVLTCYAILLVRADTKAEQLSLVRTWARIAVTAAEQLYTESGKGAEKKARVLAFLKSKGFNLDESSLDAIIESVVLEVKNAIGTE